MIKVIEYIQDPYKDFRLGWAIVEEEGGGICMVQISKNKNGHVYGSFASVKVGESYRASRELRYRSLEASYFAEVIKQVTPYLNGNVHSSNLPLQATTIPPASSFARQEAPIQPNANPDYIGDCPF